MTPRRAPAIVKRPYAFDAHSLCVRCPDCLSRDLGAKGRAVRLDVARMLERLARRASSTPVKLALRKAAAAVRA